MVTVLMLLVLFSFFVLSLALSDFSRVAETGNYTCDELVRWLGTEKHYSNDKKNVLFGLVAEQNCQKQPSLVAYNVKYGTLGQKRTFFSDRTDGRAPQQIAQGSKRKCSIQDDFVVAYLSNYSINNNFSHFLHGLLRLFCALMDTRVIVWSTSKQEFVITRNYTIWLDEYFKLTPEKEVWLRSFGGTLRSLKSIPVHGDCIESKTLVYGSGCVRLLPPEKWFGYPGCRSGDVLTAFGAFMRQRYSAQGPETLKFIDNLAANTNVGQRSQQLQTASATGLRVAYAVRAVGAQTGMRHISNLGQVQALIRRTQHVTSSMENVTFEHLDVASTIRYMAGVHIFVSVHGAGMTNMFFMNPGAAVVEIIPFPLCNCKSPDYFYGVGGYYHGSAVAQQMRHYPYCVPPQDMTWHTKPKDAVAGGKCSWRHLHAVESVYVDPTRFVSLMRSVERDLVVAGTIVLTKPIISISPHANG